MPQVLTSTLNVYSICHYIFCFLFFKAEMDDNNKDVCIIDETADDGVDKESEDDACMIVGDEDLGEVVALNPGPVRKYFFQSSITKPGSSAKMGPA